MIVISPQRWHALLQLLILLGHCEADYITVERAIAKRRLERLPVRRRVHIGSAHAGLAWVE